MKYFMFMIYVSAIHSAFAAEKTQNKLSRTPAASGEYMCTQAEEQGLAQQLNSYCSKEKPFSIVRGDRSNDYRYIICCIQK